MMSKDYNMALGRASSLSDCPILAKDSDAQDDRPEKISCKISSTIHVV